MRFSISASLTALALLAALASASSAQAQTALKYAGINLAGAEFNSSKKPGTVNKDYMYASDADYAYFASQGMNVVRLPFLWERLQPVAGGSLDASQLSYLRTAVTRAKNHGLKIILDPHNYAKYYGNFIGTSEVPNAVFADLWRQLATAFANDDAVIFGLMNEPNSISSTTWASAAQAGIDAIRAAGAKNLVLVPGTAWTGAHNWTKASSSGISNGDALVNLRDTANNLAYEVHQYMDDYYSGTSSTCVSTTIGAEKLKAFTDWLRANRKVGFLGEFGAASNDTCMVALDGMLAYMQANSDVWLGWTYWAGGSWWGSYMFSVQPDNNGNAKPQMAILSDRARSVTTAPPLSTVKRSAPPMVSQPPVRSTATTKTARASSGVSLKTAVTTTPSSSLASKVTSTATTATATVSVSAVPRVRGQAALIRFANVRLLGSRQAMSLKLHKWWLDDAFE